MLLVTARTRPETLAKAASSGTPLPVRLAKTLSSADLLQIFREHATAEYGEELTELLLASSAANSALVAGALRQYPSSFGIRNAAALSVGATHAQLLKLSRSSEPSIRQHAQLSLLWDSLRGASARQFMNAIKRAKRSKDPMAGLFIVASHPDAPRSVLQWVADRGPDMLRPIAQKRLRRNPPAKYSD